MSHKLTIEITDELFWNALCEYSALARKPISWIVEHYWSEKNLIETMTNLFKSSLKDEIVGHVFEDGTHIKEYLKRVK